MKYENIIMLTRTRLHLLHHPLPSSDRSLDRVNKWMINMIIGAVHDKSTQHLTSPSWIFLKFGTVVRLDECVRKIKF